MSEHSHADLDDAIAELRVATRDLAPPASLDAAIARAIRGRDATLRRQRVVRALLVPIALGSTVTGIALVSRSLLAPYAPARGGAGVVCAGPGTRAGGAGSAPLVAIASLV